MEAGELKSGDSKLHRPQSRLLASRATKETVTEDVFLLGTYSLGLGIRFLPTGLGVNKFLAERRVLLQGIKGTSGGVLSGRGQC